MKLHIEILGLPGSGKTTIQIELIATLRNYNWKSYTLTDASDIAINRSIRNKYKKYAMRLFANKVFIGNVSNLFFKSNYHVDSFVSFMSEYTKLFDLVISNQLKRNFSLSEKEHDISYLFYLCSRYYMAKAKLHNNESLIIDEGFSYVPIRTLSHGDDIIDDYLIQYLNLIPKPHIILNLINEPLLCEERLSKRVTGYPGSMRKLSYNDRIQHLERCQHYIKIVAKHLSDIGVCVIDIDNSNRIDDVAGTVADEIVRHKHTYAYHKFNDNREYKAPVDPFQMM